ncbi:Alpha/Beta hydrolase protein [Aspergillus aurantiobrunneus]
MSSIKPNHTLTYKTVDALQIPLDVYLPNNPQNAPVLLWFHGGGLLQGHRRAIAPHMRTASQTHNFIAISADYRLAPQVSISDIFADVQDCIAFIRSAALPSLLGEGVIDSSRLAVSGSSAGGFLALLAGLYVDPKPNVIAPIYPITDPLGSFFTTPQDAGFARGGPSNDVLAPYLDVNAPVVVNSGNPPEDPRGNMYGYMLRTASLAALWGVDASKGGGDAAAYRISRNIYERGLPPAYIVHGDADTAVGVEQADEVVGAIKGCGLVIEYERVHGEEHLFDNRADYSNEALYAFVMRYL